MNFGIAFANAGPLSDPTPLWRSARAAEAAGFESLWTVEHVLVPAGLRVGLPLRPERARCPAARRSTSPTR